MPELPEVEEAVRRLRQALVGRRVAEFRVLHPSLQRRCRPAHARALAGARITRVERRGKHQLVHFDDGRVLHAHFRMNGDWDLGRRDEPPPRFARALLSLDDGSRVALVDSRALATLSIHEPGDAPSLDLGPEPDDPALDAAALGRALATRRGAIKPALLDQRVLAGLGNIYAAEALWRARIDPFAPAASLDSRRLSTLLRAIRAVLRRASGARYRETSSGTTARVSVPRLDVYDREGQPCRRCRTPIVREMQAGRSTYYCPTCQR